MAAIRKSVAGTATEAPRAAPVSRPAQDREFQLRIPCRGKSAAAVLEEARLGLEESLSQGRDPLLVFEDLGLLQDSVAALIKGLCRVMVGYPRAVTFWESSGYTEAFLSVMELRQEG